MRFLLPLIANLSEPQYRLLLLLQALIVKHGAAAVPAVTDSDIAEGCAAVAATYETAGKGIIYEHQAASLPAQRLAGELGHAIAEMRRRGAPPSMERDAVAALRRIERGARTAMQALPGEQSPVFLALLRRVMAATEDGASTRAADHAPSGGGRLIIPG